MNKEQLRYKILSKTVKTSSCWFYTGTKSSGYGIIYTDGKERVAHRLMYEAEVGEIPKGMELDHLCDVKHCVNPEHLQAVTHTENIRRGPQAVEGTLDKPLVPRKKVYCIYIKDERFRDEPKKSALINELLATHYGQFRGMPNPRKDGLPPAVTLPPVTKKPKVPSVIKTKEDAVKILSERQFTGFIDKSFSARKKK